MEGPGLAFGRLRPDLDVHPLEPKPSAPAAVPTVALEGEKLLQEGESPFRV